MEGRFGRCISRIMDSSGDGAGNPLDFAEAIAVDVAGNVYVTGYGYDFPVPAERIRMLRETVEIVTAMWSEADVSYAGRHYELEGAQCDPKPVQKPPSSA